MRMRVTPTSISVAPNSPMPRAQVRTNAEMTALRHRGSVTVLNVSNGDAPSVRATNSMRGFTSAITVRTMRRENGRFTIICANTMPAGWNTTENPACASALPAGEENITSKAKPSTI